MADRTISVRLMADIRNFQQGMQQAVRTSRQFGQEVAGNTSQANETMRDMGRGAMVAGAGLLAGFGLAARASMSFEQRMSAVAAATMETGNALGDLRDAAIEAGAETAFSATEAASAIENLAKAGISTADILGGGLAGSLDLAAAGELGVAQAAEIAATALTQFNLAGSDVGHVADLLAAAAGKAQGDVSDMGMALSQVGLVANQTGLTIEETTAGLAAFASAGLIGSDAGTSFKAMLQRLTPVSAESSALMDELGFSAFDAQGNFIGLTELAGEMQSAFGDMTVEQRNLAMATLFGSDAVRAASVIYAQGADGIEGWQEQVNDAGFASEQAAIKMDNLAGDLEELGGSIETALIQGGTSATGVLRGLTQGATGAVNALADMPPLVQGLGIGIAGFGGATLLAVGAVGSMIPRVREFREGLAGIGPAGAAANRTLGTLARGAAVAGGVLAAAAAVDALSTALDRARQRDAPSAAVLADALLEFADSGRVADEVLSAFGDGFSGLAEDVRAASEDTGQLRGNIFQESADDIAALDDALASLAASGGTDVAADVFDALASSLEGTGVSVDDLMAVLPGYTDALAGNSTQARLAGDANTGLAGSFEDVGTDAELATQSLDDFYDAQRAGIDPLFNMVDALNGNRDANNDVLDSLDALEDAQRELDAVRADGESTTEDVEDAERNLRDAFIGVDEAQRSAAATGFDVTEAATRLAAAVADGTVSVEDATAMLQGFVHQGLITQGAADALSGSFAGAAEQGDRLKDPIAIQISANTAGAQAGISELQTALIRLQVTIAATNLRIQGMRFASMAEGNAVGGFPGHGRPPAPSDVIPAMLTRGEFVINSRSAAAIGPAALHRLNAVGFAGGGPVAAGHAFANWQTTMVGNLSGTPVGQAIIASSRAANTDDEGIVDTAAAARDARQALDGLLDTYVELSDTLGQATADQILWSTQSAEGFEIVAEGALAAAEQAEEAAEAASRQQDQLFEHGFIGAETYRQILKERLAAEVEFSDAWFEIHGQIAELDQEEADAAEEAAEQRQEALEELEEANERVAEEARQREDNMHRAGLLSNADYARVLQQRLAATEEFSDDWFQIHDELQQVAEDAWDEITTDVDEFRDALDSLSSSFLGAFDASTSFYGGLQQLTDAVAENGATLDVLTAAGRDNRSAISAAAGAAVANATAVFAATGSLEEAAAVLDRDLASIAATLTTYGFTPAQVAQLLDDLGLSGGVEAVLALPNAGPAGQMPAGFDPASLAKAMDPVVSGLDSIVGALAALEQTVNVSVYTSDPNIQVQVLPGSGAANARAKARAL